MKSFKELLLELNACESAIEWAQDMTIEQVVEQCHRGDWLLWLAKKIGLPLNKLTLAKARCAKTVIHLMKDQRSIDSVNVAERFGLDECTLDELNAAYAAAAAAYAADYAAYAADYAADYAAADAKIKNQKETADICRDSIGNLIIERVNELLNNLVQNEP